MGLLSKALRGFHASPHKFDKVNIKPNLGRGEGAQVFGNGFYVAEAEPVMESYYNIFKSQSGPRTFMDKPIEMIWDGSLKRNWPKFYDSLSKIEKERFELVMSNIATYNAHPDDLVNFRENMASDKRTLRFFEKKVVPHLKEPPPPQAHRYELEMATNDKRLLDWDEQLGNQPNEVINAVRPQLEKQQAIQEAARKAMLDRGADHRGRPYTADRMEELSAPLKNIEDRTGYEVYRMMGMTDDAGHPAKDQKQGYQLAADRLHAAGIDGTKYLDQFSRNGVMDGQANKQTQNYAIWNDDILTILRRYGIPIAAGTAGAGGLLGRVGAQRSDA